MYSLSSMVRFIAETPTLLALISVSLLLWSNTFTKAIQMRGRFISPDTSSSQFITEGNRGRPQDCSLAWQTPGPGRQQAWSMSWPEPIGCISWSMCVLQNWRGGPLKLSRAQKINGELKILNINLHILNLHCLNLIVFTPWFSFWNMEVLSFFICFILWKFTVKRLWSF